MQTLTQDGFSRLLSTLESNGANGMSLAAENVTATLSEARVHGWPFDQAWAAAINRIQPSQIGGVTDARLEAELRTDRALLEEDRPYFHALYEGREQTTRERATRTSACWTRVNAILTPNTAARNRRRRPTERTA